MIKDVWEKATHITFTCSKSTIETQKKRCEICSKLTRKTPERCQRRLSGVFIVSFEHISQFFQVFFKEWNQLAKFFFFLNSSFRGCFLLYLCVLCKLLIWIQHFEYAAYNISVLKLFSTMFAFCGPYNHQRTLFFKVFRGYRKAIFTLHGLNQIRKTFWC